MKKTIYMRLQLLSLFSALEVFQYSFCYFWTSDVSKVHMFLKMLVDASAFHCSKYHYIFLRYRLFLWRLGMELINTKERIKVLPDISVNMLEKALNAGFVQALGLISSGQNFIFNFFLLLLFCLGGWTSLLDHSDHALSKNDLEDISELTYTSLCD